MRGCHRARCLTIDFSFLIFNTDNQSIQLEAKTTREHHRSVLRHLSSAPINPHFLASSPPFSGNAFLSSRVWRYPWENTRRQSWGLSHAGNPSRRRSWDFVKTFCRRIHNKCRCREPETGAWYMQRKKKAYKGGRLKIDRVANLIQKEEW